MVVVVAAADAGAGATSRAALVVTQPAQVRLAVSFSFAAGEPVRRRAVQDRGPAQPGACGETVCSTKGQHVAKDQNTYAKRQREMNKKRKAEDKRVRRQKRKEQGSAPDAADIADPSVPRQ